MQVIIDIPEEEFDVIKENKFGMFNGRIYQMIVDGTILEEGHWTRWYETYTMDGCVEKIAHCKCSKCNTEYDPFSSQFVHYCPMCGVKMEGKE